MVSPQWTNYGTRSPVCWQGLNTTPRQPLGAWLAGVILKIRECRSHGFGAMAFLNVPFDGS